MNELKSIFVLSHIVNLNANIDFNWRVNTDVNANTLMVSMLMRILM